MSDLLIQRCLGGLRLVDHLTGETLDRGLRITSQSLRFAATRSGVMQITDAVGFSAYTRAFDPVPAIAPQDFSFEVQDLTGRFLPVAGAVTLPRDAGKDAIANRVDQAVVLALPSAAGRRETVGWTKLRVAISDMQGAPVRGAVVEVVHGLANSTLGWGLSDQNGTAFVPLLGIARLTDVIGTDPGADDDDIGPDDVALVTAETIVGLRVAVHRAQPWPANPAVVLAGGTEIAAITTPKTISLTAGAEVFRQISISLA